MVSDYFNAQQSNATNAFIVNYSTNLCFVYAGITQAMLDMNFTRVCCTFIMQRKRNQLVLYYIILFSFLIAAEVVQIQSHVLTIFKRAYIEC